MCTILSLPIIPYIRKTGFAVRKPWIHDERRLLDYLLLFVQRGQCHITVEHQDYDFHPGEFCLIQPGELVVLAGTTETVTPYAHFDVFYKPQREQSFPTRPGQVDLSRYQDLMQPRLNDTKEVNIPTKFEPSEKSRFRETFLKLVGMGQNHDLISQLETQYLMQYIVLALLRDFSNLDSDAIQRPQDLAWITSYLSAHIGDKVSVKTLSEQAHLSASRFSALFRNMFGVAPYQYLVHLRIQHAQELLGTTSLTLDQIAEYCGFADVHHFSKTFKKSVGIPPRMYRQNTLSDNEENDSILWTNQKGDY